MNERESRPCKKDAIVTLTSHQRLDSFETGQTSIIPPNMAQIIPRVFHIGGGQVVTKETRGHEDRVLSKKRFF